MGWLWFFTIQISFACFLMVGFVLGGLLPLLFLPLFAYVWQPVLPSLFEIGFRWFVSISKSQQKGYIWISGLCMKERQKGATVKQTFLLDSLFLNFFFNLCDPKWWSGPLDIWSRSNTVTYQIFSCRSILDLKMFLKSYESFDIIF